MSEQSAATTETVRPRWSTAAPEELPPPSRLPAIAHAILLVLGLAALIGIGVSLSMYLRSAESAEQLRLELVSLQLVDDANPRAILDFRLHNRSPLTMRVQDYSFNLLLNGQWIGSSNSLYRGTDPNADPGAYTKAVTLNETLGAGQQLDLKFTLYIYETQMDVVRRMQGAGPLPWSVAAGFNVVFPYARDLRTVPLTADLEE
jgi:hypothetical protein